MKKMSNLANVVYKRTYSRKDFGTPERWDQTVERVIRGNTRNHNVSSQEMERLDYYLSNRKAGPAGRGWWFSGAPAHDKLGGSALNNCWFITADDWANFVTAQDLLMLGGGVGLSIEHRFVSKLPKVKKNVVIVHKATRDADFIVPDSREGWCELTRRILEAFLVTGRSFSWSTVCVRGYGETIQGFGGTASGPMPLITFAEKTAALLQSREGRSIRPIDAMDILCCIGELVVSGNVRRSAIIILGDPFDKDYLRAKRWDLGPIPTQRATANLSVVADDVDDLHALFWKTYEQGEPFGIINRTNMQQYARMGEKKKDTAVGVNPCFSPGTLIHTKQGHFPIETLVGKAVDIWDGKNWVKIDNFRVTGENQPTLNIEMQDGSITSVTPYHKCILEDGTRLEAKDLQVGMKLAISTAPESHGVIKEAGAYLKGFLIGDGTSSLDGNAALAVYDTKVSCMGRLLESAAEVPVTSVKTNAVEKLGFGEHSSLQNRQFMQGLSVRKELSPWGREYKKRLPDDIFAWDRHSKLEFIAGFMDADGTASDTKNGWLYQVTSTEPVMLAQFQTLLKTIGVQSKLALNKTASKKDFNDGYGEYDTKDLWRITISQSSSIVLAKQIRFSRLVSFADKKTAYSVKARSNKVVLIAVGKIEEKVYCCTIPSTHSLALSTGNHWGQCAEATLESHEPCNLQELALPNFNDVEEFEEAARLMHRWGKRVTTEKYHIPQVEEVIKRNRRVGTGITGCLQSPLFEPKTLDRVFAAIQDENRKYSKELGINESIRTTVIKPSGTISKMYDMKGFEGIHAAYSRYFIQRVRFGANDPLIPLLAAAGHHMEPVQRFDGSLDHNTLVVDFYENAPEGSPVADEEWDTWKQLDVLKMAQKHWADQSVSVTVYYKKEDLAKLKAWLTDNLKYLKTISFLCHNEHGFKQAPKESITKEQYEKGASSIKDINTDNVGEGQDLTDLECAGGVCPIK